MRKQKIQKSKSKKYFLVIIIFIVAIIAYNYFFPRAVEVYKRPKYCVGATCIQPEVFESLPDYPADFGQIDLLIEHAKIPILENFTGGVADENYYKQPEFYPTWESKGTEVFLSPTPGYFAMKGLGAYPGDIVIRPVKAGQDLITITFFHSAWGVIKWQGIGLEVIYPAEGNTEMGRFSVTQDPSEVKNYFEVEVEPKNMLVEPSYPVFYPEWSQKVKINIHINEITPPGKYLIGISVTNPSPELSEKWVKELRLRYTEGAIAGIGRASYQIFIEVVE